MGITGASFRSYTLDVDTELKDAGAVTATAAAQVGGSDKTLDFGIVTSGPAVTQIAYTPGWLVVDVSAIDGVTGDEQYDIQYQLSDNVTFASGLVSVKASINLGDGARFVSSDVDDRYVTGRHVIGVDNEYAGTLFRFARLLHIVLGTSPSIDYRAFLSR